MVRKTTLYNKEVLQLTVEKFRISFLIFVLSTGALFSLYGQQPKLVLEVTGQDSIETAIIDSIFYQKEFVNFTTLSKETDSIQQVLQHRGYLNIEQKWLRKIHDSVFEAKFYLNRKYKILKILYDPRVIENNLLKKISSTSTRTYFLIPFDRTESTLKFLTSHFASQGNPFGSFQLKNFTKNKDTLTATLDYLKGGKRIVDKIIYKGYKKFPPSFLRHYTTIRTGQKFSKKVLLKKAQTLNNLSFASTTRPPEVLFTKDSTSIYLYLKKKQANTFDGFFGFSNDEDNQKLVFDGYLNLNLINNLNFGESLRFVYKSDGNDQQRLQINARLPYILKTPISIEAGLDLFKKDSTFINTEQLANLHYTLTTKSDLYLGYKASNSTNLLDTPQVGLDITNYNATYFMSGFSFKNFQNKKLFPLKTNFELHTEFGKRDTETTTTDQQKAKSLAHHIVNLNSRNSIFLQNSFAILLSDNYIFNELFRFGGITSIRGFEENSLNASLYTVLNTEYRYLLSSNLYIHSIIDYGYFEDNSTSTSENLASFGFGIGLVTKSGLFKINFANGKNSQQSFKFSNTKVHLSLVASF